MAVLDEEDSSKDSFARYSSDEESSRGWRSPPFAATSSSPLKRAQHYGTSHPRRSLSAGVVVLVILALWMSTRRATEPWQPQGRWKEQRPLLSSFETHGGRVPGVKELLTPQAPASSYFDALRPDLRYLTSDSWSGLTGQFFTVLSLLHLAQLTQRVAIIPSWRDDGHYGPVITRMSLFFDLDRYRNETGALFVEWDDVKPSKTVEETPVEELGCFKASWFENALSFGDHNLRQTVWDVPRPGQDTAWSYESFTLYDYESKTRLQGARQLSKESETPLPRNIAEETAEAGLLCYTNLWDLQHAGNGLKSGAMVPLLTDPLKGVHPEWYSVGKYIDFAPAIWDVALDCAHRTLGIAPRRKLPPLLTVHIRRGDFLEWCEKHENCTPTLDAYIPKVTDLLLTMPSNTKVLVTSDETTDEPFLSGIDALGWLRVDHLALGTAARLEEQFGDSARWADGAVDQALLSLGSAFVGTEGSQVSQISQLRVQSWNAAAGKTKMVPRPI